MIYPETFEQKIGFHEIRTMIRERCLSPLGKEQVDLITMSADAGIINEWLQQVREFRRIQEEVEEFPLSYFFDVRESVARIRLEGTHMEENELFDLKRSLETIHNIIRFLNPADGDVPYPALQRLTENVRIFPNLVNGINRILDKYGKVKDSASAELGNIRRELAKTEGSISRTLNSILHAAQSEGLVEKDVTPAIRDGRLVIPVAPALKRKIRGIVHDESASGKTVFIEPTEVVEANNRMRPYVKDILNSYRFLAIIDLIQAKASLANSFEAFEPEVDSEPHIDWIRAIHPLLRQALQAQDKQVVPLDIMLTKEKRILIISGPNAGGKSVCLKTTGLLQYMLQCGLSIPVSERSHCGIFQNILIDIGDEQSIENDLSTYSSHLLNMKNMMKTANDRTLILIDEFGTGTEPQIGGAIAESVLGQFCKKKAWGVITTHYQNLKHFADSHEGIANGAMLYDRHQMQALFQLQIGQPGSSFAIEIARKIGLPEEVDIVRDKRYWESKRQGIHQHEKNMQQTIERYESQVEEVERERKAILQRAKEQAEELLRERNKKIENAIREIRESQAEKEAAKRIREELQSFKQEIEEVDTTQNDEMIARKIKQIQERKARKEKRREEKAKKNNQIAASEPTITHKSPDTLKINDTVRIKGLSTIGKIESIDGKMATVIFGDMRTKMRAERLEKAEAPQKKEEASSAYMASSKTTRETIDNRRQQFHQDIDVRGMRGDEAVNAVMYFIDDAILVGMSRVRILHGTGTGILRTLIRDYLATIPNVVSFRDEHVQFGGAGITVVDLD